MACFGEDYQTKFQSRHYLNVYFGAKELNTGIEELRLLLAELHTMINTAGHKGGKMLDIGCGPSIYTALLGSKVYGEITLSEYAQCNREELTKWINREKDAFDWKHVLEYTAQLENSDPDIIEQRSRSAIKQVIPIDMTQPDIFQPNTVDKYDCIVSTLCLEDCFKDLQSYNQGMQKIAGYVKHGGTLILMSVFGESSYQFGAHDFYALCVNTQQVYQAVTEAGFGITEMKIMPYGTHRFVDETSIIDGDDNKSGFYMLKATKLTQS